MATPVYLDILTYFYPIGNTSAVHLTRSLPKEHDARILLLGCGDIRNIAFTVYMDHGSGRSLDFTCCDIQPETIARNILLLTLAMDDTDGTHSLLMWNIYYHLYLDVHSKKLLNAQAAKLCEMAATMQSWINSTYGRQFRFCDEETFSKVKNIWSTYTLDSDQEQRQQRSKAAMQRATTVRKHYLGSTGSTMNGVRAAAPAGIDALKEAPELTEYYWKHGSTDKNSVNLQTPENINPMFVTDTSTLHYGTDPLLGFHLATAYAPLAKNSPLRGQEKAHSKLVEAAQQQFTAWTTSVRQYSRQKLTMRFCASDAIVFSYALQQVRLTASNSPSGLYRDSYHSEPIILSSKEYLKSGGAPTSFTVIDTSNLIDHIGALNLLVASRPLLENTPISSLYTESLVKSQDTQTAYIDSLLCHHFPTLSTMLGLILVEYWLNITSSSIMDEVLLQAGSDNDDTKQMHVRLTWKPPFTQQTPHLVTAGRLHFNEMELARTLHKVYLNMFGNENMQRLFANIDQHTVNNNSLLRCNRRSFALFLRFVRNRVVCDWARVMDCLLDFIENDSSLLMNLNYIQELYMCFHIYSVASIETFAPEFARARSSPGAPGLKGWRDIPPTLHVTIEIPREKLEVITNMKLTDIGSPIFHCIVQSSPRSQSGKWQNIFSGIQLAFGSISTSGEMFSDTFKINIAEDKLKWRGSSPLLATFLAPTWTLLLEPKNAEVAFGIQSTLASVHTFMDLLGYELKIFTTTLGNERNVYITKLPPNTAESATLCALSDDSHDRFVASNGETQTLITAKTEPNTGSIAALIGRLEILSDDMKKELQNKCKVQTVQTSPFSFTETLGSTPVKLDFPAAVKTEEQKTRIARKSLYVEVEAALADAWSWRSFPLFLYPTFLWHGIPLAWNAPYMNLDRLPVIDTAKKTELQWLITHTSGMFNTRERRQRVNPTTANSKPDVRMSYRDSLYTMFIVFAGLQGRQTRLFSLNQPTAGGVHVLILISNLKMDLANHSVVLDAAVLPLTNETVPRISSFFAAITELNICHITVDSDELSLWKQALPAQVERCRTWKHRDSCEYLRNSKIPLSVENGQSLLCSCGNGQLPRAFIPDVPQWNTVSKHFVRAAVSPCFQTPFSEQLLNPGIFRGCRACGKDKTASGGALLSCAKCHKVRYCSADCQRADWKSHKPTCRA